jgi:pimeloyl-ACP methyl ester carboxylesterase
MNKTRRLLIGSLLVSFCGCAGQPRRVPPPWEGKPIPELPSSSEDIPLSDADIDVSDEFALTIVRDKRWPESCPTPVAILDVGLCTNDWRPLRPVRLLVGQDYTVAVLHPRSSCSIDNMQQRVADLARMTTSAIAFLDAKPWVSKGKYLLYGVGYGSFASLLTAANAPSGIDGAILFSPEAGGPEDDLIELAGVLGGATKMPVLWLSAVNDNFIPQEFSRRMFDAFSLGRAHADFVELPAFEDEGFNVGVRESGVDSWSSAARYFLQVAGRRAKCR